MSNKLSHSAVTKYSDCAMSYKFHYVDKLRGTTQSAALLFGTAIDKAVECMVLNKDVKDGDNLKRGIETFNVYWERQEINGVVTELITCPDIVYANNDYDEDLLPGRQELTGPMLEIERVKSRKDEVGFDNLTIDEKKKYNLANWWMAKKRGTLMLEAIYNEIIPKIVKVHSTQEKIELSNGKDSVVGYTDLVADWETLGNTIIFDFKTSTRPYEEDSVRTSPQLALYMHALQEKYKTRKTGFIVLSKIIQKNRKKICSVCGNDGTGARHKTCNNETTGKRCNGEWNETISPKANITVIIDTIPEQLENIVLENFDNVSKVLDTGVYIRNLGACRKNWGLCDFYGLCHSNSMKGLVKKE